MLLKNSDIDSFKFRKIANRGETFLTESGIHKVISQSYKQSIEQKQEMIELFQSQGYLNNITIILEENTESEFLYILKQILEPIELNFKQQYFVDGYKLDAYIPSLNIAIEYDDLKHEIEHNIYKDVERQEYIENKLGCTFVRCSIRNTHNHNIGLIIKEIININNKVKLKGEC